MKKLFEDKKAMTIARYVFCFVLLVSISLTYIFTHEINYGELSTAFFVPGIVIFFLGFMSCLNHYGALDFVRYSFLSVASAFKKGSEQPYEDLVDYKESKEERRQFEGLVYLPYYIVGFLSLVVAFVFFLLYKEYISSITA